MIFKEIRSHYRVCLGLHEVEKKMKFGHVLKTIEEIPAELPKNCLRAAAGSKRQAKSGHTSDL